ncbi:hypothetical protein L2E82_44729 [Cichorium intybus]|uniref:Uncharacterized protein n=1 Tax=Cichorium intybus TaxID=13427 RepID=A0ACB8ZQL5_CICIN|nr:hypothetical protein L2E82_44729 [Cichorium intybus]
MLEFLSTSRYTPASWERRAQLVCFRLGGQSRECTLWEFDRSIWLYTETEIGGIHFPSFFAACFRDQPQKEANAVTWRRGCEKVSRDDVYYMWVLSDPNRFFNLPFAMAVSLTSRTASSTAKSPMADGHFITSLDRSYSILMAEVLAGLAPTLPTQASIRYFENMGIIHQPRQGVFELMPTIEAVGPQAEEEVEEEESLIRPAQRRRVHAPVQPPPQTQPPPQPIDVQAALKDLDKRMVRMEAHHPGWQRHR